MSSLGQEEEVTDNLEESQMNDMAIASTSTSSSSDKNAILAPKSLVHIPEVTGAVPPAPGETPQQAALRLLTLWHDAASEELKHLMNGGLYLESTHAPVPLAPLPPSATLPNPGTQTGMTVASIVRAAAQRPPGVSAQQAIAQAARELNAATPGLIPNLEIAVRNLDAQAAAQARAMSGMTGGMGGAPGMGPAGGFGATGAGAAGGVGDSGYAGLRGATRSSSGGAATRSSLAGAANAAAIASAGGLTMPTIALPTQSNPRAPRPIAAFSLTGVEQAVRRHLGDNALKLLGHNPTDIVTLALRSPDEIANAMEELASRKLELSSAIRRFQLESGRNLTRAAEPPRNKTHWDFVLGEMEWLATDYQRERKWKMQLARKLSKAVMVYHERRATLAMRAEREAELHRKRLAAHVSRMIKQFWVYISKLVTHKHELKMQKVKKLVLDDQLDKIVRTADRFSASIAIDLKQGAGSAARLQQQQHQQQQQAQAGEKTKALSKQAAATSSKNTARSKSRRVNQATASDMTDEQQNEDDADYVAESSSEDDLETLLQAEQEMDSEDERDELKKLKDETDMSVDDVLEELMKKGYEPSPAVLARRKIEAERSRLRNAERREERVARGVARRISSVQKSVSDIAKAEDEHVGSTDRALKDATKLNTSSTMSLLGRRPRRTSTMNALKTLAEVDFDSNKDKVLIPTLRKRVRMDTKDDATKEQLEREAEMASEFEMDEAGEFEEDDEETLEADEAEEMKEAGGTADALALAREQELLELEREKYIPVEELLRRHYPHRLKTDASTGEPVAPYAFSKRSKSKHLDAVEEEDIDGNVATDAEADEMESDAMVDVDASAGTDAESQIEGDLEQSEFSDMDAHLSEDNLSDYEDEYDSEADYSDMAEEDSDIEDEKSERKEKIDHTEDDEAKLSDTVRTASSFQPLGNTYETQTVRTPIPDLLRATLREYQHIGLDWLVSMYENNLNGILADEMGLGKTVMTIAWLAWLACSRGIWGQHLVIVPTSVMVNWEMEFKRFCPGLKVLCYHGSAKQRHLKRRGWTDPNTFHVCITSYQIALQDARTFKRKKWHCLILDEAHNIKNFKSKRWQSMLNLRTERRLLLTGTPLQNNLMELWALMHFLMPHIFQSHSEFRDWFSAPLTSMIEGKETINQALISRLHGVLRPFILRRLKKDVAKQLPEKYEHIVKCRLSKRQRLLYEEYVSRADTQRTLQSGSFLGMMSVLLQLRKVCSHPDLFEARPIISPLETPCISVAGLAKPWLHGSVVRLLEQSSTMVPLHENALRSSLLAASTGVRWLRNPFEAAPNFAPALLGAKLLVDHPLPAYCRPLDASTNAYSLTAPPPLSERPRGFEGSMTFIPSRDGPFLGVTPMLPSHSLSMDWSRFSSDPTSDWALPVIYPGSWLASCIDMGWDPRPPILNEISVRRNDKTKSVPISAIDQGPLDIEGTNARTCRVDSSEEVEPDLDLQEAGVFASFWSDVNAARNKALEEIRERNARINELRTSLSPHSVYPTALARLLRVEDPVANVRVCLNNVRHPKHHSTPRALADMVKLPAERSVEMEETIVTFTCLIPKARVTNATSAFNLANASIAPQVLPNHNVQSHLSGSLPCLGGQIPTRRDDMSSYERDLERMESLRYSIASAQDIFHTRAVRSIVHFPDKRLLQWDCGKLQALARLLVKLKSGGHRVLIFTQFSQMLDILEAFLNSHAHTYLRLDGATKAEERAKLMERFNTNTKYFCFILSTRAGGVGINLTGADTVIFFDSDWNPAIDQQAQDRCHRIGQTREVHIYRLVTENSVEENILKKSQQKQLMNAVVIGDGQFTTEYLDRLDPRELLGLKEIRDSRTQVQHADSNSMSTESNLTSSQDTAGDVPTDSPADARQLAALLETLEDEADRDAARRLRAETNEDAVEFSEATSPTNAGSGTGQDPADIEISEKFAIIESKLTSIQRHAFRFAENYVQYIKISAPRNVVRTSTMATQQTQSSTTSDVQNLDHSNLSVALKATESLSPMQENSSQQGSNNLKMEVSEQPVSFESNSSISEQTLAGNLQGDQTHPNMSSDTNSADMTSASIPAGAATGVVSSSATSPSTLSSNVVKMESIPKKFFVAGLSVDSLLKPTPPLPDAGLPELPQPQLPADKVKFDLKAKMSSFADINQQTMALFAAFPPVLKNEDGLPTKNYSKKSSMDGPSKLIPPASYLDPSKTAHDDDKEYLRQLQRKAQEGSVYANLDPVTGRPLDPLTSLPAPLPSADPTHALSAAELGAWSPYHPEAYSYPAVTSLPSASPMSVVPSTWHAHMLHKSRYATARLALQHLQVRRLIYDSRVIRPPALPTFEDDFVFPVESVFDYADPDRCYGSFSAPYSVARMLPRTRADASLRSSRIRSMTPAGVYSLPRTPVVIVNEELLTLRVPTWHLRAPGGLASQHTIHSAISRQKELRKAWPTLCRPPSVAQALAQGKLFAPLPSLGKAPEGFALLTDNSILSKLEDEENTMSAGQNIIQSPTSATSRAAASAAAAAVAAASAAATAAMAAGSAARGNLAAWSSLAHSECELNPYPLPNNVSIYCHPYTSMEDSQLQADGSHIPNRILNLLPSQLPFGVFAHHPWSALAYDGTSDFGVTGLKSAQSLTSAASLEVQASPKASDSAVSTVKTAAAAAAVGAATPITNVPTDNAVIQPIDPNALNALGPAAASFSTCPLYVPPSVQKIRSSVAYSTATAPAPGAMYLGRDPQADSLQAARLQPWLKRAAMASAAVQLSACISLADPIVDSRSLGMSEYATWTPRAAIAKSLDTGSKGLRSNEAAERRAGLLGAVVLPLGAKRKFDELYDEALKGIGSSRSGSRGNTRDSKLLLTEDDSNSSVTASSDSEPSDIAGTAIESESETEDDSSPFAPIDTHSVKFVNNKGGLEKFTFGNNPYKYKRYRPTLEWRLENPRRAWPSAPLSALLFRLPSCKRGALPLVPQSPPAPMPLSSPLAALQYAAVYALHEQCLIQAQESRKSSKLSSEVSSVNSRELVVFDRSGACKSNNKRSRGIVTKLRSYERALENSLMNNFYAGYDSSQVVTYSALDRAARLLGLETTPSLRGHFARAPDAPGQGLFGDHRRNRRIPMPVFATHAELPSSSDALLRKSEAMWRGEEDEMLTHLVSQYGSNWTLISDLLTMHPVARQRLKTARQCCMRFSVLMHPYKASDPPPSYILTFASAAAEHSATPVYPAPPRSTPLSHLPPPLTLFSFLPAMLQPLIVNAFLTMQQQQQQASANTNSATLSSSQSAQGSQSIASLQVSTQAASWANQNQSGSVSPTDAGSAVDRKKRKGALSDAVVAPSTPTGSSSGSSSVKGQKRVKTNATNSPSASSSSMQPAVTTAGSAQPNASSGVQMQQQGVVQNHIQQPATFGANTPLGTSGLGHTPQQAMSAGLLDGQGQPVPRLLGRGIGAAPRPMTSDSNPSLPPYFSFMWMDHGMRRLTELRRAARLVLPTAPTVLAATPAGNQTEEQARAQACKALAASPHQSQIAAMNQAHRMLGITSEHIGSSGMLTPLLLVQQRQHARLEAAHKMTTTGPRIVSIHGQSQTSSITGQTQSSSQPQNNATRMDSTSNHVSQENANAQSADVISSHQNPHVLQNLQQGKGVVIDNQQQQQVQQQLQQQQQQQQQLQQQQQQHQMQPNVGIASRVPTVMTPSGRVGGQTVPVTDSAPPTNGQSGSMLEGSSQSAMNSAQSAIIAALAIQIIRSSDGTLHYAYRDPATGNTGYAPYDQNSLNMIIQHAQQVSANGGQVPNSSTAPNSQQGNP